MHAQNKPGEAGEERLEKIFFLNTSNQKTVQNNSLQLNNTWNDFSFGTFIFVHECFTKFWEIGVSTCTLESTKVNKSKYFVFKEKVLT